ncbi:MAG: hypothetical protein QOE64_104 [Frankiales bacterium]|nr:hypothetical protein [Frankiales bacterium]
MSDALYGSEGFYRRELPAAHFRTSAHASPALAHAVLELAGRLAALVGEEGFAVVDVGAGGGELLASLAPLAPPHWRLVAVEIRERPADLDSRIEWTADVEYGVHGLVLANEWLDNVPVDVAERAVGQWQEVLVDERGVESRRALGPGPQLEWLSSWWSAADGDRVEVGHLRDAAWADLADRLDRGVLAAVDYALDRTRQRTGTLVGYRHGDLIDPVPDGSCDITAHVLLESIAAAGERAGLTGTQLLAQSDVLASLGVSAGRPPLALAQSDPLAYLAALSSASHAAELLDPEGLGSFSWLLQGRGVMPGACFG